jgi:hypothetical protein
VVPDEEGRWLGAGCRVVCLPGTAHGPCPRRRADRTPFVPGALLEKVPAFQAAGQTYHPASAAWIRRWPPGWAVATAQKGGTPLGNFLSLYRRLAFFFAGADFLTGLDGFDALDDLAATLTGGALGFAFGLRVGARFGGVLGLLRRLVAVGEIALVLVLGLEVGLVPAGALQAEHRCGHQFLQRRLLAARAVAQRLIGNFLQDLDVELAVAAFVFVERHGYSRDPSLTGHDTRHGPMTG